jgi:hypothetical protein
LAGLRGNEADEVTLFCSCVNMPEVITKESWFVWESGSGGNHPIWCDKLCTPIRCTSLVSCQMHQTWDARSNVVSIRLFLQVDCTFLQQTGVQHFDRAGTRSFAGGRTDVFWRAAPASGSVEGTVLHLPTPLSHRPFVLSAPTSPSTTPVLFFSSPLSSQPRITWKREKRVSIYVLACQRHQLSECFEPTSSLIPSH